MNVDQKRKLLIKIQGLRKDIDDLTAVRKELLMFGYASATISSGGGSKSYTRMDVSKVTDQIKELKEELKQFMAMLTNDSSSIKSMPKKIYQIYY